jgi:hypothetical protein
MNDNDTMRQLVQFKIRFEFSESALVGLDCYNLCVSDCGEQCVEPYICAHIDESVSGPKEPLPERHLCEIGETRKRRAH